ncbi:hypothetical protein PV963_31425 [Streptomyces coeruleorubidus]|uniref:hypothetical protein n=1 Tax=Streptomyces coeruleorubidus TaxID=116188 RepID=UPI00237F776D|nr:hypothetical protein [Streptomyces coeruleorubidus]WDV54554.1 hypothetical protein PV963_31425 [Streptomyces coeruleorubidus]
MSGDQEAFVKVNDSLVQTARHRTVYDLALVFYGVLTVLALEHPLTEFAESVASKPAGHGLDDWTQRLLTLTLMVLAAVWLHTLVISLELNDTRQNEKLYPSAIYQFWAGVVMVVILMTLGKTVERSTTAFLTASLAYLTWGVLFALLSLAKARSEGAKKTAKYDLATCVAGLVIALLMAIWASSHPGPAWQFTLALAGLLLVLFSVTAEYCTQSSFYSL